jgi:hypothetical protein
MMIQQTGPHLEADEMSYRPTIGSLRRGPDVVNVSAVQRFAHPAANLTVITRGT